MKYSLSILIAFLTIYSYGQKNFIKGQKYYVWAYNGLKIHEKSNIESSVLTVIPYGEEIIVDSIIDMKLFEIMILPSLKIDKQAYLGDLINDKSLSYSLKGKMVKIRYQSNSGYVFDGFLSELEPIYESYRLYALHNIFEKKFGILAIIDKSMNSDNPNSQVIYKNGYIFYKFGGVNWSEDSYLLRDLTFQEAILILYNYISRNNINLEEPKWFIKEKGQNFICFDMETSMFQATIRQINNIVIITINFAN